MSLKDRINEISCRAGQLNLSLWRLCALAGADYSTIKRWENGEVSPTLRVFERETGKLDAKLDDLERALFERLADKFASEAA
jgi:transcriptional regulator with XRE-family HTH domain